MKAILASVLFLTLSAGVAYASCTTHTYFIGGRTVICTTCCYGNNCTTTCN